MKVKIDDEIYDSNKHPIMIVLSVDEKNLIASMDDSNNKFCSFPSNINQDNIMEFMKDDVNA